MQTMLSAPDPSDADWSRLRPVIDDAIVELGHEDREAVVLRFFGKHSLAEVGTAFRVSDEAARKRVDRALEKLRVILTRRGINSTGAALTAAGTIPLPANVAARVTGNALAHAGIGGVSSAVAALAKLLAPFAAMAVVGAYLITNQRDTNRALTAEIARLGHVNPAIATLHAGNLQLTRSLAAAEDLRRLNTELPALRAALETPVPTEQTPRKVALSLGKDGTLQWDNQPVTLREFVEKLAALEARAPATGTRTIIRADSAAPHEAVRYLLDEVRKAKIKRL